MTTSINHKKKEFEKRKREAKVFAERLLDEIEPLKVHLMDIDQAQYSDQKIETEVMVCAKDEVYHVPKVFTAECRSKKCDVSESCPYYNRKQKIHILSDNKELIDFTELNSFRINGVLKSMVPCEFGDRSRIQVKIVEKTNVQDLLVVPKVTTLRTIKEDNKEFVIDQLGREYRDKQVYTLTPLSKTNEYFKVIGWVKANPKNQIATLIITDLQPLNDDFQEFKVTETVKEEFKVFQAKNGSDIKTKTQQILTDLTNNVTQIYGEHRKKVLLGILLTYHSVIGFKFGKEKLKRGWVEMVEVGDTAQGKTQMFDNLQKHIGLGAFISGTSATRTGVAYSYQQIGSTWYLKWGIYVLSDGKLLFIDEGQCIKEAEWNKLSSGRSDGKITASGIKAGEHYTRTRLVVSCNPRDNLPLDESMCGVATLKQIFRPADIRRFDIAIFLGNKDQKGNVIDILDDEREHSDHAITGDILYKSVCWAWTRVPGNVRFGKEAIAAALEVAKELKSKYEAASDIPLITSDAKHKVARLSVALACLLHSTDDTHEEVVITKDHVQFIRDFLVEIYDYDNCSLNIYATLRKEVIDFSDEDYEKVLVAFTEADSEVGIGGFGGSIKIPEKIKIICLEFASNDVVERNQLADLLDLTPDNVTKELRLFKDLHLIKGKSGKRGYKLTAKFKKILKKMINEGSLAR